MTSGNLSGNGYYSNHYTNIYGYEVWNDIPINGGEVLTKKVLKSCLNYGWANEFYCDAKILDSGEFALITYELISEANYSFSESEFSNYFINSNGGGQYFYHNIFEPVTLNNGKILNTNRLRTSYIENEYLVMSCNRANAGEAYLDIQFPNNVNNLYFESSLWSHKEDINGEIFCIKYYKDEEWCDYKYYDLSTFSTNKNTLERINILFPRDVSRVEFYSYKPNPTSDGNKGRICLYNFGVE